MISRAAIILAAGQGTRMKSDKPKVLQRIDDKPLINYVLDSVDRIRIDRVCLVVGYKSEDVMRAVNRRNVEFILQETQLGTGHAVMQCKSCLEDFSGTVAVLNGDVPCLRPGTISDFMDYHESESADATVLTAMVPNPVGYGRIVRGNEGELQGIIEDKDADDEIKSINEINSGLFCFNKKTLFESLREINRSNKQNEYYLTDVIGIMRAKSLRVRAHRIDDHREVAGVNTIDELQSVGEYMQGREV